MKFKRTFSAILAAVMVFALSSCKKANLTTLETTDNSSSAVVEQSVDPDQQTDVTHTEDTDIIQLAPPEIGEEIVVMTTSMGTIKMRLFPDEAPKAVENFKGLIGKGYYDGLIFHRVINEFMIQGGDPTGTGTGGESFFGEDFEVELAPHLFHFRGALAMANTGMANSNGSQFYIVQGHDAGAEIFDQLKQGGYPIEYYPQNVIDKYAEVGGVPYLDANIYPEGFMVGYTVFGQVFEGMDVVDAIAAVSTDMADKPLSDVTVEKVELVTYEG